MNEHSDRDKTEPPARDDEPCLCDTDFTCMADHEEADLREYVRVLVADVDLLEAKVADAWDEGYIHGRQMQADATADEAKALTWTPLTVRAWLANTARSLSKALRSAKGSIHDNPYRAALTDPS